MTNQQQPPKNTHFLNFWRELNSALVFFGKPEALFGDARRVYEGWCVRAPAEETDFLRMVGAVEHVNNLRDVSDDPDWKLNPRAKEAFERAFG